MRCRICDGLPPEHRPYVVWHTGCDGCEEHDRDYYDEGVVVCADCIEALRYAGIGLDGDACVIDLQCSLDMWAQDTLWHAFWTPERVTVCEADCARRYLDRSGNKDVDPAWDWLHMVRCGRVQGRFGFRPMPSFPDRRHGRACRRVSETRRWLGDRQHARRTEACRTAGRGRDGEAWCPDHWHVECDECHVHESGHADTLEYHGWQVEERTLCPECAKQPEKGTITQ